MTSLAHLTDLASPLTGTELDTAAGGILPIIAMFVVGFGAGFAGSALWDLANGN